MHILSRSEFPVSLLTLLLLNSSPVVSTASDRSICVRQNAPILAAAAGCGDRHSLERCFRDVPSFVTLDDLQRCFIDVDCTLAEAASEAVIVVRGCDESRPVPENQPELRRRGPDTIPAATPTPTPQDKSSESTSPASATTASLTRPTECSTARVFKTTVCPVTSLGKDNFSKLPCTPTTLTTLECAATNICSADSDTCMFRNDGLQLSGAIVTIVLSVAAVAALGTLIYFYALERRARRAAREKLEEEKRLLQLKLDQDASDAKAREFAKLQMQRERRRRQLLEAQEWARRRAMEGPRPVNPFAGDGEAAAAPS
ncbi:hypothetical protein F4859DRAFT_135448 [Xylaria cf. heliscus]|nr:hypothetical protein F4859DRAFT_135448 [Xylaria cf. heliscus]